jgi:hypothetical protein
MQVIGEHYDCKQCKWSFPTDIADCASKALARTLTRQDWLTILRDERKEVRPAWNIVAAILLHLFLLQVV